MINKSIFFLSFILITFYIFSGLPYEETSQDYSLYLSIFRILYFTIFIIFSYKLKELAKIQYGNSYNELKKICNYLILFSVFIIFGFFTQIFIILHFVFYLYLFRKKRAIFYGIEQSYHQICGIFFIFSNNNLHFSIDKFLGINNFIKFNDSNSLNFLILSISVCLISGFCEKLKSKAWRSGQALNIFLNTPHVKKKEHGNLFKKLISIKYFCFLALANQLILFVLFFHDLRIFFYIGELLFSLSIIILGPFHFIGETFALIFSFLILNEINYSNNLNYFSNFNFIINFNQISYDKIILNILLINSFIACFYRLPRFLDNLNRYSLGMSPFLVYRENHLYGIRVFKISGLKNKKIVNKNLYEFYNEDGIVGNKRFWMPTIIYGLTYRITDICERKLKKINNSNDKKIIINTFQNVLSLSNTKTSEIDTLKFYVKTINPNLKIKTENWIDKKWYEIAEYNLNIKKFKWTGNPSRSLSFSRKLF